MVWLRSRSVGGRGGGRRSGRRPGGSPVGGAGGRGAARASRAECRCQPCGRPPPGPEFGARRAAARRAASEDGLIEVPMPMKAMPSTTAYPRQTTPRRMPIRRSTLERRPELSTNTGPVGGPIAAFAAATTPLAGGAVFDGGLGMHSPDIREPLCGRNSDSLVRRTMRNAEPVLSLRDSQKAFATPGRRERVECPACARSALLTAPDHEVSVWQLSARSSARCETFPMSETGFVSVLRQKSREREHAQCGVS